MPTDRTKKVARAFSDQREYLPPRNQLELQMNTATKAGQAGLRGWRQKVADGIAEPVADRSRFDADQIRAIVGAAFLILSSIYVFKSLQTLTRQVRIG